PLVGGRFNVVLGPVDTTNHQLTNGLYGYNRYFLELKIGTNNPITPRQEILSAPFALRSASADNAGLLAGYAWSSVFENGNPAADKILGSKIKDGTITSGQIADGTITGADIANGAVGSTQIANGAVTTAQLANGAVT